MTDPDDNVTAYRLSGGRAWFPSADGTEMVEIGTVDSNGESAPAESFYGAEVLRRLTDDSPRRTFKQFTCARCGRMNPDYLSFGVGCPTRRTYCLNHIPLWTRLRMRMREWRRRD